jgi:hypothetical protein
VLKKLLVWAVVLVVTAMLAVPAFAQAAADLNMEWGSDQWLVSQFGVNGDIGPFCQTIGGDPDALADWLAQYPNLANVCDFTQATEGSGDTSGTGGGTGLSSDEQTSESGDISTENTTSG